MVRRMRSAVAWLLSLALLSLNPGWSAAASVIKAQLGSGVTAGKTASVGSLPKLTINPGLNPALNLGPSSLVPGQKLSLPDLSANIAPHLGVIGETGTSAEGAVGAGSSIQSLLEGRNAAETASLSDPVSGSNSGFSPLGPSSKQPLPAVEDDYGSYNRRRWALQSIAKEGIVASLPKAGPNLTKKILDKAASRKYLFTDFDDTIGAFNSELGPELVAGFAAAKKAGKIIIVVTDRTDEKRPNSKMLTVFESLATIPAEDRAGMYVAANGGGRVYRYNAQGEPERVYEQPAMDEAKKAVVAEAAAETKSKLSSIGATQHPGDAVSPSESFNPYGYALMLSVGTPEATVKQAAKLLQSELAAKGVEVEVLARMAKNPANPPYITFSGINKSMPVAWISEHLGIKSHQAVAIGDSMYMPRLPETLDASQQALKDEAERLGGSAMPLTGNETDRNMEKGLPQMMALSVGGTADPRMENAWVLEGHGPAMTLKLLEAMARTPTYEEKPLTKAETLGGIALLIAAVGASLTAYYFMYKSFIDIATGNYSAPVNPDEVPPYYGPIPTWEDLFQFSAMGGIMLPFMGGSKDKGASPAPAKKTFRAGPIVGGLALALASPFIAGLFAGMAFWAPGAMMALALAALGGLAYVANQPRRGLETLKPLYESERRFASGLFIAAAVAGAALLGGAAVLALPALMTGKIGVASLGGAAAMGGIMMQPNVMPNPSRDFALALDQAVKTAAKHGYTDDQVYFGGATASLPRRDGREWSYSFYFSRDLARGSVSLAYVDILTGWTSTPDFRVSYFQNVESPFAASALHELKLELGPEQALDAVRAQEPLFGSRVSMQLTPTGAYTIYDERGGKAVVDGVTKQVSILTTPPPVVEGGNWSRGKTITLSIFVGLALLYLKPWIFMMVAGAAVIFLALRDIRKSVIEDRPEAPGVSDADVESAARSVISYKGRPWSQTEYNMGYYNALENLEKRGASAAQLERFKKLCDEAPVKGGGFNPWSGD